MLPQVLPSSMSSPRYVLVTEHDPNALQSEVNRLAAEGYTPLGGVAVVAPVLNADEVAPLYAQAVWLETPSDS